MALLEEATNSRSLLARDDYDARRWRDEAADSREQIASSRSVVINAVDGTTEKADAAPQQTVAANTPPAPVYVPEQKAPAGQPTIPVFKPVAAENKPVETANAVVQKPVEETPKKADPPAADAKRDRVSIPQTTQETAKKAEEPQTSASTPDAAGPMDVGSLLAYAVKQQAPVYPPAARNMRTTGMVRVEVTVDENGEVAEVQKLSGPSLLQSAAKDAIRRWKFKPFTRDGQPVRATGFVNFNFSL
jgi:protein TonB